MPRVTIPATDPTPNGHTRDEPLLIDAREVAKLLRVHPKTVTRLADRGELPKPLKLGRAVRWSRQAIQAWIAAQMAGSANEKK